MKSSNLNLELTPTEAATDEGKTITFTEWWQSQNGTGGKELSNAEILDKFLAPLLRGEVGQILTRTKDGFAFENPPVDGKETIATSGAVTQMLVANTFYLFTGDINSLTITLGAASKGESEYKGQFHTGNNVGEFKSPASITWVGGNPVLEANRTYLFSIEENIGIMVEV